MTAEGKDILVDELEWCFLQHVVHPLRVVELAQREVQFHELGIGGGGRVGIGAGAQFKARASHRVVVLVFRLLLKRLRGALQ